MDAILLTCEAGLSTNLLVAKSSIASIDVGCTISGDITPPSIPDRKLLAMCE